MRPFIRILSVVGVIVTALLLLRPLIYTPASVQKDSLTDLATIMGAILTAGGFVVTLVSLLTFVSIKEEIQRAATEARVEVEKTLSKSTAHMLAAYDLYLRARAVNSIDQAETLVEQAIAEFDHIIGPRYFMGARLHQAAREEFLRLRTAAQLVSLEDGKSLAHRAVSWLQRALNSHETPEQHVHAMLAESYGILGLRTHMERHLRAAVGGPETLNYAVPCLLHGCGNELGAIERLASILDQPVLDSENKLRDRLKMVQPFGNMFYVTVWVIPRPQVWADTGIAPPLVPGMVAVQREVTKDQTSGLWLWWRGANYQPTRLPPRPDPTAPAEVVFSIDEVALEITERFFVVSEFDPRYSGFVSTPFPAPELRELY